MSFLPIRLSGCPAPMRRGVHNVLRRHLLLSAASRSTNMTAGRLSRVSIRVSVLALIVGTLAALLFAARAAIMSDPHAGSTHGPAPMANMTDIRSVVHDANGETLRISADEIQVRHAQLFGPVRAGFLD